MKKHFPLLNIFLLVFFITGCGKHENSYFPTKVGLSWTYQYSLKDSHGILKMHTLETREISGKKVIPIVAEAQMTSTSFVVETDTGIYDIASQSMKDAEPQILPSPKCRLKFPLKVGTTWGVFENTWLLSSYMFKAEKIVPCNSTIESLNETVTVPAGTFSNCLKVKTQGRSFIVISSWGSQPMPFEITMFEWYAPGVGLIKAIYKQKTDNNLFSGEFDEQLQSFTNE